MSRPMLPLPAFLPLIAILLAGFGPVQARTLQAKIAKVSTAIATLEGVSVRLDWHGKSMLPTLVITIATCTGAARCKTMGKVVGAAMACSAVVAVRRCGCRWR